MTFLPPDASTEYTVYSSTCVRNNCTQQACIVCISESTCVCTEALIRGLERYSEDRALLFSILASRPSSLLSVSIRFRGARLLHSPLSSLPHHNCPGWRLPLVSIVRSPRSPRKPNYSPPTTKETGAEQEGGREKKNHTHVHSNNKCLGNYSNTSECVQAKNKCITLYIYLSIEKPTKSLCFTYMQRKVENLCIALACPITGSLSWWLCLASRQTVIHMSVLWPRFHLEQFHRGHWKQKSSRVKDLNPCLASVAITTPCASPFI